MSPRPVPRSLRAPVKPSIPVQPVPGDGGAARSQPQPVAADRPAAPRPRPRWAAAAAGVLTLALAGGGLWLDQRGVAAEDARREGLAAAVSAATVILSYDHARIDQDVAAATARTTGAFRAEYRETSRAVVPVAKQYQAVVKATVTGSAVVSATPDEVVALLFVDQATQSTRVTGTKIDQARVRLTVRRTGGRWLVSRVEAL